MSLNPDAVGEETGPKRVVWSLEDCMLYALGVGAGVDELEFTTENTQGVQQQVLPTFPAVFRMDSRVLKLIGEFDLTKLVHAAQQVEVPGPLPTSGAVLTTSRVANMYDKGTAALVVIESDSIDEDTGALLFRTTSSLYIAGAGGWGGDRGPRSSWSQPTREPDHQVEYDTRKDQALLYRMCGDRNPLHSDPTFARRAGFDRPILHGLCTFGFAGRAVLHTVAERDVARVHTVEARFAAPVWPGDTLRFDIWSMQDDIALFQARRDDRSLVLANGRCTLD